MGLVLVVPYANEKSIEDFPLIVFFFLKFIDKYNTIYNINKERYKTKIKGTDKIQLLYGMYIASLVIRARWREIGRFVFEFKNS